MGAGQFGVVFQAQQIGSVHDSKDKQLRKVAVKMIKSASDTSAVKSLLSELKILIHLGSHLNVVNLLGACTKRIADGWSKMFLFADIYLFQFTSQCFNYLGELLVILELCEHGSIRDYLLANSQFFADEQLNEIIKESHTYENVIEKGDIQEQNRQVCNLF